MGIGISLLSEKTCAMKKIAVALLLGFFFAQPTYADGLPQRFIVTGSGFGHGVGLSQMGARGLALEGKSATDILNYFFPGTTIQQSVLNQVIRVNVAHSVTYTSITANGPIRIQKSGVGLANVLPGSALKLVSVGKVVSPSIVTKGAPTTVIPGASLFTLAWDAGTIVTVNSSGTTIKLAYGTINVRNVSAKLEVTTSLKLDTEYIYGISEMSSAWPAAAIQSQAIAARTYGLARMNAVRKDCDCNLYATKYDQVFTGFAKESEAKVGSLWKSAVDATSGMVVTYNGAPINMYFSSSSGGVTQTSADVWGTSYPYLTNVPDPWSLDIVLNPSYAHWQRVLPQRDVAAAFGLSDISSIKIDSYSSAHAVLSLTAMSSTGQSKTLSVSDFKVKLKIPASWFEITANN